MPAFVIEEPDELAYEQRVAPTPTAEHPGGRQRSGGEPGAVTDESRGQAHDVLRGEAVEVEVEAGEVVDRRVQGVPISHVGVAVGADDGEAPRPGIASEELEQAGRRAVGPLQVVQHDDDRSWLRRGGERLRDGICLLYTSDAADE